MGDRVRARLATFELPRAPNAPRRARAVLSSLLGGVPEGVREDALLLASELVTNSVLHARGDRIWLQVGTERGRVLVRVSDEGPGVEASSPVAPPEMSRRTGRGLYLVDSLATRWGTGRVEGRPCVWFEIDPAARG